MGWTKYQLLLAGAMTISGTANTLSLKWADKLKAADSDDNTLRDFDHPFFQTLVMFWGESLCLLLFHSWLTVSRCRGIEPDIGPQKFSPIIFLIPALCDSVGSSLMYMGLTFTFASSFQMLRGSIIVFVAALSITFLRRRLRGHEWAGIVFIVLGLLVVGTADIIFAETDKKRLSDTNGIIAGDLLIVLGQVVLAVQVVVEDKFFTKYQVTPAQSVGWEGVFGTVIMGSLMFPFYYLDAGPFRKTDPAHRLEDLPDAFEQMGDNRLLIIAMLGSGLSIATYNFCGVSVTKEIGGPTRMVLDSTRTIPIWAVSVASGWQEFIPLQIGGFVFLMSGICIFNNILVGTLVTKCRECKEPKLALSNVSAGPSERSHLINGQPKERQVNRIV